LTSQPAAASLNPIVSDTAAERVGRSLLRLAGAGSFAAVRHEPALGLSIDVDGVGRCDVPLSPDRIAALLEHAVPSPFGYREETVHDRAVRDSWEIPGSRVHLDPLQWRTRFRRGLDEVVEALGLSGAGAITPRLQKLLVYEEGQFFTRHRDSEKSPNMVGTLVVVLPSAYRGGEVVVSHAGQTVTLSTATAARTGHVSFLGFYADCVHETRPVLEGHRVALSYALEVEAMAGAVVPSSGFGDLRESLRGFFGDPDDDDEPLQPWLVYLLDHQYSEQGIAWSRLKNADKVRAEALRHVAAELEHDCFLALADVHESYEYEGDEEDGDDESDDDEGGVIEADDDADPDAVPFVADPEVDDPIEQLEVQGGPEASATDGDISLGRSLLERELTLDHWLDTEGRPCAGTDDAASDEHVVTTVPSHHRVAYDSMCEPWTGNEGGTAEKWYHQAALVVVPRRSELHEDITRPRPPAPSDEEPPAARAKGTVRIRKRGRSS
jgi:hypothetical protein